jgi:hypothetical protein
MTSPTGTQSPAHESPYRRRSGLRLVAPPLARYERRRGENWMLGLMFAAMTAITVLTLIDIIDPGRLVMNTGHSQRPTTTAR